MQLSKIVYIVAFKRYEIRDVISSDRMVYFLALSRSHEASQGLLNIRSVDIITRNRLTGKCCCPVQPVCLTLLLHIILSNS